MAELPHIDPEAIKNLRALNLGDNDEFLREIIGIFLEDTPQRIAELYQSLAANDVPTFTRAAHSIKGSSSNLGTLRLREIAEKLEHDARKTGLGEIAADVAALKIQFAEVQVALRKYFSA
jgi:HPt (histidine-containing phosphotransfer) domain-containing protein